MKTHNYILGKESGNMGKGKILIETTEQLLQNKNLQGMILGKYSDGTPRSIPDAINGVLISPKERKKELKKINKRKKKHKAKRFKL